MSSRANRWVVGLAVSVAAGVALGRAGRRRSPSATGNKPLFPAVTGDTWPPVPINPDRRR